MAEILEEISEAVDRERRARRDRDVALRAARDAGVTWQAIADAADMTPNGVRWALSRTGRGEDAR